MIITIANEKGGSGKSTLCLNLCVQLLLDKKDIVALDTDSQKSLEVFNNIRSETSLPNFTLFKPPKQKSQTSLVFGMNALVPLGTIKTL